MKNILFIFLITFSTIIYSQGMKIKWEDSDGREFSIKTPNGELSYGMIAGDNIRYNYSGKVSKVGSVFIKYNYSGKVSKVGGLFIKYNYRGRISGTSGSVN